MSAICIYFKVHQPFQLRSYASSDIGMNHIYEDPCSDRAIINDLADRCYLRANELLLSLIHAMDAHIRERKTNSVIWRMMLWLCYKTI